MNTSACEALQADALAAGFDEVLEGRRAPDTVIPTHTYAFGVEAVVTQRDAAAWRRAHASPDDGKPLQVGLEVLHDWRYGSDGATCWVARRDPR